MYAQLEDVSKALPLFELTSDAVAVCSLDGTIVHANGRFAVLTMVGQNQLVGVDIKDLLFSPRLERATEHRLPLPLDSAEHSLMLKVPDGSFIPVVARARAVSSQPFSSSSSQGDHVLVVVRSVAQERAHVRQERRMLAELRSANKRLAGTLDVIISTMGSTELPELIGTVLNKLVESLDASGATVYFSESGGFKLRGFSFGLESSYIPEFVPFGVGTPTYVVHAQRACRFRIDPPAIHESQTAWTATDLDTRASLRLRAESTPPFKALISVPVYFGSQVLGIIELGWNRPRPPRANDVRMLEIICDYLSMELVGLVSSMRSRRTEELTRSLNRMREDIYALDEGREDALADLSGEMCRVLSCHLCSVEFDAARMCDVIDFEGGSRVDLPVEASEMFLSTTTPAARINGASQVPFVQPQGVWSCTPESLTRIKLVRVDATSWAGEWLASRGLPSQGIYFDLSALCEGEEEFEDDNHVLPHRFLLLRNATQEPIDDIEYDYLVRLGHDLEMVWAGRCRTRSERRIAQALQAGMRSELGIVPGITTDALYSSATRQALVGGDFYTLIRLPDDCAVMILGDVSGKGIEAASMSALVKTALTAYAWEGAAPEQMVRSLNSMLMSFSRVETFATMFVAKIDLKALRASYCSAGHPPTMLVRTHASVREVELLPVQSGVVGAFETMVYEAGSFSFTPGDVLFMYTDGAIEVRNPHGEFFGERRLRDAVLHAVPQGIDGLCASVLSELDSFSHSALDDDIAMVALRLDGLCEE